MRRQLCWCSKLLKGSDPNHRATLGAARTKPADKSYRSHKSYLSYLSYP
jgi:hypothetical protein